MNRETWENLPYVERRMYEEDSEWPGHYRLKPQFYTLKPRYRFRQDRIGQEYVTHHLVDTITEEEYRSLTIDEQDKWERNVNSLGDFYQLKYEHSISDYKPAKRNRTVRGYQPLLSGIGSKPCIRDINFLREDRPKDIYCVRNCDYWPECRALAIQKYGQVNFKYKGELKMAKKLGFSDLEITLIRFSCSGGFRGFPRILAKYFDKKFGGCDVKSLRNIASGQTYPKRPFVTALAGLTPIEKETVVEVFSLLVDWFIAGANLRNVIDEDGIVATSNLIGDALPPDKRDVLFKYTVEASRRNLLTTTDKLEEVPSGNGKRVIGCDKDAEIDSTPDDHNLN